MSPKNKLANPPGIIGCGLPFAFISVIILYRHTREIQTEHSFAVWVIIWLALFLTWSGLILAITTIIVPLKAFGESKRRSVVFEYTKLTVITLVILMLLTRKDFSNWAIISSGVIGVLLLATIRAILVRIPARKPVSKELKPSAPDKFPDWKEDDLQWDIFISYRTENSNEVRRLADSLIYHGYRPWFAEYEILPSEWDDSSAIKERLIEGVARSRYFLVVTNDAWSDSAWCNEEMKAILKRSQGSHSLNQSDFLEAFVAEIRLPSESMPHFIFPALRQVNYIEVRDDILEVWPFLENELGWCKKTMDDRDLLQMERVLRNSRQITLPGGIVFRSGGLEAHDNVFESNYVARGWEFANYAGHWGDDRVGLRVLVNPYSSKTGAMIGVPGKSDDRSLYRNLLAAYESSLLRFDKLSSLGIHLVHLPSGQSALGVSQLDTDVSHPGSSPTVSRVFDIPLHRPSLCRSCGEPVHFYTEQNGIPPNEVISSCQNPSCHYAETCLESEHSYLGQVEFSFLLSMKSDDPAACHIQLAKLSSCIEQIVSTIRMRWWARFHDWQVIICYSFIFLLFTEVHRYFAITQSPHWVLGLCLFGIGFSGASLLICCGWPGLRRQIMKRHYGAKLVLLLGTWFPRWWNVLRGVIVYAGLSALFGLPLGLVGIISSLTLPDVSPDMMVPIGAAVALFGILNLSIDDNENISDS